MISKQLLDKLYESGFPRPGYPTQGSFLQNKHGFRSVLVSTTSGDIYPVTLDGGYDLDLTDWEHLTPEPSVEDLMAALGNKYQLSYFNGTYHVLLVVNRADLKVVAANGCARSALAEAFINRPKQRPKT